MSKIKSFDAVVLKALRNELNDALKGVADKYGISIEAGNASFGYGHASFKLELATVKDDGTVMSKEANDFLTYCTMLGLKQTDLGREFEVHGKKYKLKGYRLKSRKFPFIVECINDGKEYGLPEQIVKSRLAS